MVLVSFWERRFPQRISVGRGSFGPRRRSGARGKSDRTVRKLRWGGAGQTRLVITGGERLILVHRVADQLLLTVQEFLAETMQFRNFLVQRGQALPDEMQQIILHIVAERAKCRAEQRFGFGERNPQQTQTPEQM